MDLITMLKQVIWWEGFKVQKKKMYPPFYNHYFHKVNLWGEVFWGQYALRDVVIPYFGHYVKLASSIAPMLDKCAEI